MREFELFFEKRRSECATSPSRYLAHGYSIGLAQIAGFLSLRLLIDMRMLYLLSTLSTSINCWMLSSLEMSILSHRADFPARTRREVFMFRGG